MKSKKAALNSTLLGFILVLLLLGVMVIFLENFRDKALDAKNSLADPKNLEDLFGIKLDLSDGEIRYNLNDELDPEFRAYVDLILHQIFDPEYVMLDRDKTEIYKNSDKKLRWFEPFPLDSKYGFEFWDDGEGIIVFITTELNNKYLYTSYKNLPFLKNKHIAIVKGNIEGIPTIDKTTIDALGSVWILRNNCPYAHTTPYSDWTSYLWSTDMINWIDPDWRGLTNAATTKYSASMPAGYFLNDARSVYPLNVVGMSLAKEDDKPLRQLFWIKNQKDARLEYNKAFATRGHLILTINSQDSKILLPSESKYRMEDHTFVVFFPTIDYTIVTGDSWWNYDISNNCKANKGVCVVASEKDGAFIIEGHGFLFGDSVHELTTENIKACN